MTPDRDKASRFRRALGMARRKGDPLAVAHLRLRLAWEGGRGVRLTADEVHALLALDTAMTGAGDSMAEDYLEAHHAD